jgi:hypothetical protein
LDETARSVNIFEKVRGTNQFSMSRHSVRDWLQYSGTSRLSMPEEYWTGELHSYSAHFHSIFKSVRRSLQSEGSDSGKLGSWEWR